MRVKSIQVLSSRDTQRWHSPFSKTLRDLRQSRIVHRCQLRAQREGYAEFVLYDAYETLVATGLVEVH